MRKRLSTGLILLVLAVPQAMFVFPTTAAAPVTLQYWLWDGRLKPATQDMVDAFTRTHPHIRVRIEAPPSYYAKLLAAIAAGSGPDVFWMNGPTFKTWARRGLLQDLSSFIKADPAAKASLDAMWPVITKFYKVKTGTYVIPRGYDTTAMIYNESLMDKHGLVRPAQIEDTWDWNTLLSYGKKLTVKDGAKTTQYGLWTTGWDQTHWLNYLYAVGGEVFRLAGDGSEQCVLDSPEAIEAIQWVTDRKLVDGMSPASADNWQSMLMTGKLAMTSMGDWELNILAALKTKAPWNVAQFPIHPRTGKRGSVIHGYGEAMSPASKHKREAWQLMAFMASKEAQVILGKSGAEIPARLDADDFFFSPKLSPPNRIAFKKAADYAGFYPSSNYIAYDTWVGPVNQGIQQAYNAKVSVEQALSNVVKTVRALYKKEAGR